MKTLTLILLITLALGEMASADTITTKGGVTFRDALVVSIGGGEARIWHAGGESVVQIVDLPTALNRQYTAALQIRLPHELALNNGVSIYAGRLVGMDQMAMLVSHDGLVDHLAYALLPANLAARCPFNAKTLAVYSAMNVQRHPVPQLGRVAVLPSSSAADTPSSTYSWNLEPSAAEKAPTSEGPSALSQFIDDYGKPIIMLLGAAVVAKAVVSSSSSGNDDASSANQLSFDQYHRIQENHEREEKMKAERDARLDAQWDRTWSSAH